MRKLLLNNIDFLKDINGEDKIGCNFCLDLVNVEIVDPGVSILIEIPL